MKYITKRIKIHYVLALAAVMVFSSCNKDLEQFSEPAVVAPTGDALGTAISKIADDSLYYKLILRAGPATLATLNTKSLNFTMFVPNNAAMRQALVALGAPAGQPDAVYVGFINTFIPAATAASIVNFNILAQKITTASIPNTFPNFYYPSNLNPTSGTPAFNPLVRLVTFPSTRNGNWINNIPLVNVNNAAANGVFHTSGALAAPPQRVLAQRIFADPDMTYFAAAVQRADSGVAPTSSASLVWVLSNFGPNLTTFVPTNAAFQGLLTAQITGYLVSLGVPLAIAQAQAAALASSPAIFSNPLVANVLTPTVVKGIVVYHMMGSTAFLNNFPTTATSYRTLLNSAVPTHPGVSLTCGFTGPFVSSATIKGAANATASTILINPTPEPGGTSDQFYVNGTLHKINQVLLPQ